MPPASEIIRKILKATGMTQGVFSKNIGVSQGTVSKWISEQQSPNKRQWDAVIELIAADSRLSALLNEDVVPKSRTAPYLKLQPKKQRAVEHYDDDMTHAAVGNIPEIDLRAGASYAGGFAQEEVTFENGHVVSRDAVRAQWGIPLIFLRDELHVHPGRVHILPIRGDSMADALFDGDRAGVDLDDVDISQGGIFAILDDNGSVIIKQVELLRDNKGNVRKILCKSRNPHYQPFELTLEDPVRILGRVAFRITRL